MADPERTELMEPEWIESGLRYCLTHNGVLEADEDEPCDFGQDINDDEQPDCVLRPLCYLSAPGGQ